jgi:hypothetical protein
MAQDDTYQSLMNLYQVPYNNSFNDPIIHFSKYNYKNSVNVAQKLTDRNFINFWNKSNVSDEGIAYRVQTNINPYIQERGPHLRPDYKASIETRDATIEKIQSNYKPNPNLVREYVDKDGNRVRQVVSEAEQISDFEKKTQLAKDEVRNISRIDKRFFTPLKNAVEEYTIPDYFSTGGIGVKKTGQINPSQGLPVYLDFAGHWQRNMSPENAPRLPISILMNEKIPNYSLEGRSPFGNKNFNANNFQQSMGGIKQDTTIKNKYGLDLGERVSSNPSKEVFVPKTLGSTARRVGNTLPDGSYEIWGPPKTPVPMQYLEKAGSFANNAVKAVGVAGLGYSIYEQGPIKTAIDVGSFMLAGPTITMGDSTIDGRNAQMSYDSLNQYKGDSDYYPSNMSDSERYERVGIYKGQ